MRGIRWQCDFYSHNGTSCHIHIYEEGYVGTTTTVVGAPDPFYCEEENSEDLLDAIRFQTGYISLVERTHGELDDLYPLNDFQHYVTVTYGGTTVFNGYMQAQAWSNSFEPAPRVLQFPVISPLGLLSAKKFNISSAVTTTVSSLLQNVVNGMNAGYSTAFNFPTIYKGGRQVGLDDVVSMRVVSPYNEDYNCKGTEPLYKAETYEYFMKGLCAAYGVMVHDTPGALVFTRPESATGSSYALENVFQFADSDGTESLVMPIKEVTLNVDGESLEKVDASFKHSVVKAVVHFTQIGHDDEEAYAYTFEPETDEIASAFIATTTLPGEDWVLLASWNPSEPNNYTDRQVIMHGDSYVEFRWNQHTAKYGTIQLKAQWGRLGQLGVDSDLMLTAQVYCNGQTTDGDTWSSGTTQTVRSYNGQFEFSVPQNWVNKPVYLTIYNPFAGDLTRAFVIESLTYGELGDGALSAMPWYDVKSNKPVTISGGDDNADSVSLDMCMSYAVANSNMISDSSGNDRTPAHTTNYAYMFRSQRRIECTVKKKVAVSDIYNNTYTYNGETYRVIAVAYYPWDDNYKLTLQTVYTS